MSKNNNLSKLKFLGIGNSPDNKRARIFLDEKTGKKIYEENKKCQRN